MFCLLLLQQQDMLKENLEIMKSLQQQIQLFHQHTISTPPLPHSPSVPLSPSIGTPPITAATSPITTATVDQGETPASPSPDKVSMCDKKLLWLPLIGQYIRTGTKWAWHKQISKEKHQNKNKELILCVVMIHTYVCTLYVAPSHANIIFIAVIVACDGILVGLLVVEVVVVEARSVSLPSLQPLVWSQPSWWNQEESQTVPSVVLLWSPHLTDCPWWTTEGEKQKVLARETTATTYCNVLDILILHKLKGNGYILQYIIFSETARQSLSW